ncbi:MAG: iron ABC transporter substrate-binding protein [Chloroflexi bacterium]|nr:iron ABC transporter substrate-binding protein [Chloroflexota bacterium]
MLVTRRRVLVVGAGALATIAAACGAAPAPTAAPTAAPKVAAPTAAPTGAPPAATVAPTTAPAAAPTTAPPPTAPAAAPTVAATAAPSPAAKPAAGTLTLYSGRSKDLIEPLLAEFGKATGITVNARFGDSAQLAAALLEEGKNSPTDVFFSQDAGALGAVAAKSMLAPLPDTLLKRVDERLRSAKGEWVGVSARARVVVYDSKTLKPEDLPDTVAGFTDPKWKDKLGWPPTNASFQAFITAMRLLDGEAAARKWLVDIKALNPKTLANNALIVEAVNRGELQAGFVNHYYLFALSKGQPKTFSAQNYSPRGGGAGAIVNVAGAGILPTAKNAEAAKTFVDYLLSTPAQQYFADKTYEYPLVPGIRVNDLLPPLSTLKAPNLDLSRLADLEATLKLLTDTGVL